MAREDPSKAGILTVLTIMLILGLVAAAILLLIGVGLGYLLRFFLPSLDLGQAILIGVVAFSAAIHLLLFVVNHMIQEKTSAEPAAEPDEDEMENYPDRYLLPQRRRRRRRAQ